MVRVNLIFLDAKSTNKHAHFICTGVCVYLRADTVDIVIWRTFFQFRNFTARCFQLAALQIRLVFCTHITVLFLGRISCILLHVRFCVNSLMSPYYTAMLCEITYLQDRAKTRPYNFVACFAYSQARQKGDTASAMLHMVWHNLFCMHATRLAGNIAYIQYNQPNLNNPVHQMHDMI